MTAYLIGTSLLMFGVVMADRFARFRATGFRSWPS